MALKDQLPIVKDALQAATVHVRLREQELQPSDARLQEILDSAPVLRPFGTNQYVSVKAVFDWDHNLPSEYLVLRLYCAYSQHEARLMETQLRAREQVIDGDNVFPEFDLPDYGAMDASESYVGVVQNNSSELEDLRFFSDWRKEVRPATARGALSAVRKLDTYKRAYKARANDALGPPVVVGWTPPSLAETENWAIEVWLITEFDGQSGKAMVFMIDSENLTVSRQYLTDVHVA